MFNGLCNILRNMLLEGLERPEDFIFASNIAKWRPQVFSLEDVS